MAIVSKNDLVTRLSAIIGEDKNDDAISLVEDMSDTLDDYAAKTQDETKWKEKYEENDRTWREKYISRFQAGVAAEDDDPELPDDTPKPKTFEELFTVKEKNNG